MVSKKTSPRSRAKSTLRGSVFAALSLIQQSYHDSWVPARILGIWTLQGETKSLDSKTSPDAPRGRRCLNSFVYFQGNVSFSFRRLLCGERAVPQLRLEQLALVEPDPCLLRQVVVPLLRSHDAPQTRRSWLPERTERDMCTAFELQAYDTNRVPYYIQTAT